MKICTKCGVNKPDIEYKSPHLQCNDCIHIRVNKWKKDHKAQHLKQVKEWKKNNRQRVRDNSKKNYLLNKDSISSYMSQWHRDHPGKKREWTKKYFENNPLKAREYTASRRARVNNNGGSYIADELKLLFDACGGICLCCGKEKPLTADHIVPISKGGSNEISNIQPLCQECNSRKGTKVIDYRVEVLV